MIFSAFATMGLYRLSAKEPDSRALYQSMISGLGHGTFNTEPGSRMDVMMFARAMGIARLRARMFQALDERRPSKTTDLLPVREAEFGVVPGPRDSIKARRRAVAARKLLPAGNTRHAMEVALSTLLGSDFIAYKTVDPSAASTYPSLCGDWPMNLQRPDIPRKIIALAEPVAFTGTPITVLFNTVRSQSAALANRNVNLVAGDVVVFDVGRYGQQDRVTVSAVTTKLLGLLPHPAFTATFLRPHEPGTYGFTHPLPSWESTKRHAIVVVSPAAAASPETRRKIHELMRRMARSVSTWSISAGTGSSTVQWSLGVDGLGYTTLVPIALP